MNNGREMTPEQLAKLLEHRDRVRERDRVAHRIIPGAVGKERRKTTHSIIIDQAKDLDRSTLKIIYEFLTKCNLSFEPQQKFPDHNSFVESLRPHCESCKFEHKQLTIKIQDLQGEEVELIGGPANFIAAYLRYKTRVIQRQHKRS